MLQEQNGSTNPYTGILAVPHVAYQSALLHGLGALFRVILAIANEAQSIGMDCLCTFDGAEDAATSPLLWWLMNRT